MIDNNHSQKKLLNISIFYIKSNGEILFQNFYLTDESTVDSALECFKHRNKFEHFDPWKYGVGIFGIPCKINSKLNDGDRIEIYKPLIFDPKESRKRRMNHRLSKIVGLKK